LSASSGGRRGGRDASYQFCSFDLKARNGRFLEKAPHFIVDGDLAPIAGLLEQSMAGIEGEMPTGRRQHD
jgi:hypothetical protein